MRASWVPLIFLVSLYAVGFAEEPASQIYYMTEDYPPGNYLENGKLTGASVDILKAIWRKMNVPEQPIHVLPWPRAYSDAQTKPRTMLFTMTWTEARKNLFAWVGPFFTANIVLVGLKGKHPLIKKPTDARRFLTSVIREDISELSLQKIGFQAKEMVRVNNYSQSIQLLRAGRVQFACISEDGLFEFSRLQKNDLENVEIVSIVDRQGKFYAFHKATSPELLQKFQSALESLGVEQDSILARYNLHR